MTTMTEKRSDEVAPQAMTDDDAAMIAELLDSTLTAADAPNVPRAARLELLRTVAKLAGMDTDALTFTEHVLATAERQGVRVPVRWLYEHRDLLSRLNRELSCLDWGMGWGLTADAASRGLSLSYDDVWVMLHLACVRDLNPDRARDRDRALRLLTQYRRLADIGVPRLATYVELTPPRGRGVVSAKTLTDWRDLLADGMPAELILTLRGYTDADVARVRDLLDE